MRTLKSSFVLFFVFLISASILLDSTHYESNSISDKFEEIHFTADTETSFSIFSKRNFIDQTLKDSNVLLKVKFNSSVFSDFVSKIKSYLHLLQLP